MTGKRVVQYDFETDEYIGEYRTITEAAYDNYVTTKSLSKAICQRNGVIRTIYGKAIFKYKRVHN